MDEDDGDYQCEECDRFFYVDEAVFDSERRAFCSEECKEENVMWRCEMREIAKFENDAYGYD
jgi:hypothetical protein